MSPLEENKKEFIDLLSSVDREGVAGLIDYLFLEKLYFDFLQ